MSSLLSTELHLPHEAMCCIMADGVQRSGASEHNLRGPFHGVQHRLHHLWCSDSWQLEEGTTGADCDVNVLITAL